MTLENRSDTSLSRRELLKLGLSSAAVLALGPGIQACSRDRGFQGPARHVILISLDTLRRDHVGCHVKSCIQTPRLDALAKESILFDRHITPVTTTLASHTSMFTGKYPQNHGVPRNGFVLHPDNLLLTQILKKAGFDTAGILGSFALDSRFGLGRAFDNYDEEFDLLLGPEGREQNERRARSVTDTVIDHLDDSGVPQNLFLFAHYFDPHQPYAPPAPFDKLYTDGQGHPSIDTIDHPGLAHSSNELTTGQVELMLRYAGETSYTDREVGRLLDDLRARGILDDSILIITADHGENLGDAPAGPIFDHGWTVYQPEIRSPFLVRLPGAAHAGTRATVPSSHIDILPTITRFLGLPTPSDVDGIAHDLTGPLTEDGPRPLFSEATKPRKNVEDDPRWINAKKARCLLIGSQKYIHTEFRGTEELYDLSRDPYERENLLVGADPRVNRIVGELREMYQIWAASARPLASHFDQSQREETIERLRSLGYIN